MRQWYAVYCRPRQEGRADEHLRRQGFEVFFPRMTCLRQRSAGLVSVTEALFPRYLFIRLDRHADAWAPIRSTRGVMGLVRAGQALLPVPDDVIDSIDRRIDPKTGCVDLASQSDYKAGEVLQISKGPFAGCRAIFEARTGNDRVVVLLDLMQQAHRVIVDERVVARL